LSQAAAQGTRPSGLIRLFCQATRAFFHADGAYFWRCESAEELVGAEADGFMASNFIGRRLTASDSAVAIDAVRQRRMVYVNDPAPGRYSTAEEFDAKSLMAAPLLVSNEVIGAAVFLHTSRADYFNDDLAAKATILAGQLGNLLEASRLIQVSREKFQPSEILAEVAQAIQAIAQSAAVAETLAERLRVLLRTELVCVFLQQGTGVELHAVAAESSQLATDVAARLQDRGLQFASELTLRALAGVVPVTVTVEPATYLDDLVPAGMLVAVPLNAPGVKGAVFIYPRREGAFSREEKDLLTTVVSFGAVAIANGELNKKVRGRVDELQNIRPGVDPLKVVALELNSELDLQQSARNVVNRVADVMAAPSGALAVQQATGLETLVLQGLSVEIIN